MSTPISTEDEYKVAVAKAQEAAKTYYDSDTLLMSDAEYDALLEAIEEAGRVHGWRSGDLLESVAAGQSKGGDEAHPGLMGSLDKAQTLEALEQWQSSIQGPVTVEPKLDGLAIRAVYTKGKLTRVVTRGDGSTGENVTFSAQNISGLPSQLPDAVDLEVRGEVYMTDSDFDFSNTSRVQTGRPPFANPRNAVAGSLRNSSTDYRVRMSFAAYGTWPEDAVNSDHCQSGRILNNWGIATAAGLWPSPPTTASDAMLAEVDRLGHERPSLNYPIDGAVVKAVRQEDRERAGTGTRAPKWAIAYKYAPAEGVSTLREIEVSVGRTGRISLRGVIDPVVVGGTTITYATLHNPAFVTSQGLGIGSRVMVVRAGDVIPRITAGMAGSQEEVAPWAPPNDCPQCSQPWNKTSLLWKCETPECSVVEQITYAVSRNCLDVDGMSEAICAALVNTGRASSIADLFELNAEDLANTPMGVSPTGKQRFLGQANARKIAQQLEKAKSAPVARVVASLGLHGAGTTLARRISQTHPSLKALREATIESLTAVEGVGDEKAHTILNSIERNKYVIDRLIALGLGAETNMSAAQTLSHMRIVVSGAMDGPLAQYNRDQVHELIESHGGTTSSTVTSKTTHLVTTQTGTSKARKARDLGVTILTPTDLAKLISLGPDS